MSQILNTSVTISLCKRSWKWSGLAGQRIRAIYQHSQIRGLLSNFCEKTRICFRYSLLGRITETKQAIPGILDNSRVMRYLIDFYKRQKDKTIHHSMTSLTVGLAKDTEEQFNFSAVKIIGIVVITAVVANVLLSIIFQKQIDLWTYLIWALFLFVGISGLFCRADWLTVKGRSILLREMQRKTDRTKRLKVLRIIARLNIGGPAIHTVLLSEGLDKSRFETVLVIGTIEQSEGDMFYLAREKGIRPVIIPQLGRALNIRNDLIAFWKIFCLIRKEKPDIIHTHTAKAGALGRLAALLYKFTYYLHPMSYNLKLFHTFHGHVLHNYFGRIKSAVFIWIEKLLAIFTHKIVAVSESVRKELVALKISGAGKIITVPLGLELEKYLKIEKDGPRPRDYKTVGIIGRLVPVKNHQMFLDAAKRLRETRGFKQRIKFLIVGDGPLRQELETYAQKLGIKQSVAFTGWIEDLEKVYFELDIATLTSLNEGTPVALIEAQAAACPCVATKVGGVGNVVEDSKSGFLVCSQDTDEFVAALIKLLNNPTLMRTMGKYGRDRVKDRFSRDRLVEDMETLYSQEVSG